MKQPLKLSFGVAQKVTAQCGSNDQKLLSGLTAAYGCGTCGRQRERTSVVRLVAACVAVARCWSGRGGRFEKDEDDYFFMADSLKRMINASGYKVWPVVVETMMHYHPPFRMVCVIATRDAHRDETVKAIVVRNAKHGKP